MLSASAAPVLPLRSAKRVTNLTTADISEAKAAFGHERLVPAKANGIKKAPATVKNDSIVADDVQAVFYEGTWMKDGVSKYEFDFFDGDDLSAYVVVEAPEDSSKIVGSYSLIGGAVVVAEGDTTDIASGMLAITYETTSKSYHFVLSAVCANTQTYKFETLYAADELDAIDYGLYIYYQYGLVDSYLIELDDAPFAPTGETIDVIVENASTLDDATATSYKYFQIIGEDDNYYASICVNTSTLTGTFTNADIDYDYTGLYLLDGDDETKVKIKSYDSNTVTVSTKGDTTIVEASLMAKDGNIYHIVLKHYIPTPTSFVNIAITDGEVDADTYANYKAVIFSGETDDYELNLIIYTNGAGNYTTDDVVSMNSYSYLGDYTTGYIVMIMDVKLKLADDNSFTATLISNTACQYNITFTPAATAVENVEAAKAKAMKAIRNGQIVILKNGVEYNALGVQL